MLNQALEELEDASQQQSNETYLLKKAFFTITSLYKNLQGMFKELRSENENLKAKIAEQKNLIDSLTAKLKRKEAIAFFSQTEDTSYFNNERVEIKSKTIKRARVNSLSSS